jgi:hypothetical protein
VYDVYVRIHLYILLYYTYTIHAGVVYGTSICMAVYSYAHMGQSSLQQVASPVSTLILQYKFNFTYVHINTVQYTRNLCEL